VTDGASVPYTVYVVGAGLSADIGYPLTRDLLFGLKRRVSRQFRNKFEKVVAFHHPRWDKRWETLPDIEELLTEMSANEDLLLLRPHDRFGPPQLRNVEDDLMIEIASWFHEIHESRSSSQKRVTEKLLDKIRSSENPVVVSFNWDYELDKGVFGEGDNLGAVVRNGYGLGSGELTTPSILKPHGSLNWYLGSVGLVVSVWVVRLENAQSVPDRQSGSHNQKSACELLAVGPSHRVDGLPANQHCHYRGFTGARSQLERGARQSWISIVVGIIKVLQKLSARRDCRCDFHQPNGDIHRGARQICEGQAAWTRRFSQ
jgi:hypothetical protein